MIKKFFWLLPFASFITGYILIQFLFATKELQVPILVGKNLTEACELLSQQNLNIRILARKEDADLPPHTIISQTPRPNEKIKPHQAIYVVLSAHSHANHAPSLVQKSIEAIHAELNKVGIEPTIHFVPSPYPTGICIAQFPRPGEIIEKNNITIYCAAESKKPIIWPDFTQKQLRTVKELLETIQIEPQIIHNPSSYQHEISDSCMVIDQRPRPGTILMLDQKKPITVQLSVD